MQLRMQNAEALTQEQIHEFLKGSRADPQFKRREKEKD
jgi:hypothetical protein